MIAHGVKCFRPLTGIMVLIGAIQDSQGFTPICVFPSPYGDYGSYQITHFELSLLQEVVSVPLRGLWFLSDNDKKRSYSLSY